MSHRKLRSGAAALGLAVLLASPAPARAGRTAEALLGTGCALLNLGYGPLKMTYALVGGLVGGIAFAVSAGDPAVAAPILDAALRGDYVVAPAHLRGRRELEFIGRSEEQRRARERAHQRERRPAGDEADGENEW